MVEFAARISSGEIVVMLDRCPFFDAAGLGELVRAHNTWGERFFVVVPEAGIVNRLFEITGLSQVLNVKPTIGKAPLNRIAWLRECGCK